MYRNKDTGSFLHYRTGWSNALSASNSFPQVLPAHFLCRPYLFPPENGHKKSTAYNTLHVRWLLQSYFCFSVGSHLQDRIVWSQILITTHIPHLQHCFSFMLLSPIGSPAFFGCHSNSPLLKRVDYPYRFLPPPRRGKTRSSILACGRAFAQVRYSSCAAVRLSQCHYGPMPFCCHPTPCGAI